MLKQNIYRKDLIKQIKKLGYKQTRHIGSHSRLTTNENGKHHITIPQHTPLKIGTLSNILKDIAQHFEISKEELVNRLF
ncbi:MAG: type II toxin-antitoxin system HicA family toxin [Bacteroidota bacterium]